MCRKRERYHQGGKTMNNVIRCNVESCLHNVNCSCSAPYVEVACDNCARAVCDHETLCKTFRKKGND